MKEKVSKVAMNIFFQSLGIVCDAALIYNFVRREHPTELMIYCNRYITIYTIFCYIMIFAALVMVVHLSIAVRKEDYRKTNEKMLRESAEANRPKLWKTIWRWTEAVPMLFFVGIFVGNYHLFTLWFILIIFGAVAEKDAKKLLELFQKKPEQMTFTSVMEELDKKASLN